MFSLSVTPTLVCIFWARLGAYSYRVYSLANKFQSRVEVTDSNKHSSLPQYNINKDLKKICDTVSRGGTIKLFTVAIYGFRNKLECLSLASLSKDKHASLLWKSVNYGRKKFCDTVPRGGTIKLFTVVIYRFS